MLHPLAYFVNEIERKPWNGRMKWKTNDSNHFHSFKNIYKILSPVRRATSSSVPTSPETTLPGYANCSRPSSTIGIFVILAFIFNLILIVFLSKCRPIWQRSMTRRKNQQMCLRIKCPLNPSTCCSQSSKKNTTDNQKKKYQVRGDNSSKEVWYKPASIYASVGLIRKVNLFKRLIQQKTSDSVHVRNPLNIFWHRK